MAVGTAVLSVLRSADSRVGQLAVVLAAWKAVSLDPQWAVSMAARKVLRRADLTADLSANARAG